jgi:hypothetical protein
MSQRTVTLVQFLWPGHDVYGRMILQFRKISRATREVYVWMKRFLKCNLKIYFSWQLPCSKLHVQQKNNAKDFQVF